MIESDIMEAVYRLEQAEDEFKRFRFELGEVFRQAAAAYSVTDLSRMTGLNRPKIYWLMEKSRNENDSRSNRSR